MAATFQPCPVTPMKRTSPSSLASIAASRAPPEERACSHSTRRELFPVRKRESFFLLAQEYKGNAEIDTMTVCPPCFEEVDETDVVRPQAVSLDQVFKPVVQTLETRHSEECFEDLKNQVKAQAGPGTGGAL